MNKILFSIYTKAGGHSVVSFDTYDKTGKNAFDQAIEYVTTTYNDPNDRPKLFMLTEIPMADAFKTVYRTPAEWEAILKVEVVDPDGWRYGCRNGEKTMLVPITEAEFRDRCAESTVMPLSFYK